MKKIFTTAILALFVLVLSSCSSDSANETVNNNDIILLKKLVEVYEDGTQESATYTYNGTKLATTTYSNGRREITTYTGDLITKVETYDNNILTGEELFAYDTNNRIITHTTRYLDENNGYKNTFAYNNNGTIATQEFYGDAATQTSLSNTGLLTVVDDNVMRHVFRFNGMSESVAYFTYDTKNNPNRNVTGFKQYSIATIYGGVNNITSRNDGSAVFTTTYTYNSDNYPVSGIQTNNVGEGVRRIYYTY
jgi:hypothetical protein